MVFWDLPTGSTTGAPEGDSLSVLACLHLPLRFTGPFPMSLFPLMAMLITGVGPLSILRFNFTSALRLQIDFEKSWHWSIAKEFRTSCSHQATFPSRLSHM